MTDETLTLRKQPPGFVFRTTLTDRVGTLRDKRIEGLRVTWRDGRGPALVHTNLEVEPWPRGS